MKSLLFKRDLLAAAQTVGVVLPTGRVDNPDNLTDLPFGDGQLDVFYGLALDQFLPYGITFNEYAKFTYQSEGTKEIRLKTDFEPIEVEKAMVAFKLGNKVEAGASMNYENRMGIIGGAGFDFFRKFMDQYDVSDEVQAEVAKETDAVTYFASAKLGYSTVAKYQRGQAKVPFMVSAEHKRNLAGQSSVIANMSTVDINLFF